MEHLWWYGRFICEECKEELDDIYLIKTVSDHEVCEHCAMKCFECDNQFSPKEMKEINGNWYCEACREQFFVIYDTNLNVYLEEVHAGYSKWHNKSSARLYYSMLDALDDIIIYLNKNTRYKAQRYEKP